MSYFTIQEAELFTFFRIPKALFTDEGYKGMTTDARVLYGILLDRVSLSVKNNWVDEEGRVFIIFTREEIQELLGFGNQKVVKLFKELHKVKLIEETKQGLNKPNIIYVKKFLIDNNAQTQSNPLKCENHTSENVKITLQEMGKSHTIYTNINNTDINDTDKSVNQSKKERTKKEEKPIRQTDRPTEDMNEIFKGIEDRLDIHGIQETYPHEQKLIQEITLNIFDMYCSDYTTVDGQKKPKELVRSAIMRLTYFHIEELIRKYKNLSTLKKINNPKAYMQTMIYNIAFENELAITNEVKYTLGY